MNINGAQIFALDSVVVNANLLLRSHAGCLRFVIVVFPDHTHLLFLTNAMHHHRDLSKLIYYDETMKRLTDKQS